MQRQIELAKRYGIYGFSFYYYWFDGERLLEKPLEMFLQKPEELNFPFSLCWANENWTRRFDGTNSAVLMEQPSSLSSYKAVIKDMVRFFRDKRYIEIDGKKLLTVYRPSLMPHPCLLYTSLAIEMAEQGHSVVYLAINPQKNRNEQLLNNLWLCEISNVRGYMRAGVMRFVARCKIALRLRKRPVDVVILTNPVQLQMLPERIRKRAVLIYDCMDLIPAFYTGKRRALVERCV